MRKLKVFEKYFKRIIFKQKLVASEPKWVNSDFIQYGVNSFGFVGHKSIKLLLKYLYIELLFYRYFYIDRRATSPNTWKEDKPDYLRKLSSKIKTLQDFPNISKILQFHYK